MDILVAYANLSPDTARAVMPFHPKLRYCPEDDSYWEALAVSWKRGRTFINVEHDIVPTREALEDLWSCGQPWCAQPYWSNDSYNQDALGCTKFSEALIAAVPDLFERIGAMPKVEPSNHFGGAPRHWLGLDRRIVQMLNEKGYEVHRHAILVAHGKKGTFHA